MQTVTQIYNPLPDIESTALSESEFFGFSYAVSGKFMDEFKMACGTEVKSSLKIMMGHVHVYVTNACKEYFDKFRRHVYVTPKSYLSFIQGYKELYSRKWAYTQELSVSIQVTLPLLFAVACTRSPCILVVQPPGKRRVVSHQPLSNNVSQQRSSTQQVLWLCPAW